MIAPGDLVLVSRHGRLYSRTRDGRQVRRPAERGAARAPCARTQRPRRGRHRALVAHAPGGRRPACARAAAARRVATVSRAGAGDRRPARRRRGPRARRPRPAAAGAAPRSRGELVAPADELVDAFAATLVARPADPAHLRAGVPALRRAGWARSPGPRTSPPRTSPRYHAHLVAGGRSTATVKKDRAALNTFLRWLVEHDHVPAARSARRSPSGCRAPSARARAAQGAVAPASTTGCCARPRRGSPTTRSPARATSRSCSCSATPACAARSSPQLERRDFLPARKGAQLRALDVRHGKGDRQRRVKLSAARGARDRALGPRARPRARRARRRRAVVHHARPPPARRHLHARGRALRPAGARRRDQAPRRRRRAARRSCATRTRCGTRARPSCCAPARTSPTSATSSATRRSRRRRSTCTPARAPGGCGPRPRTRPPDARRGPRRRRLRARRRRGGGEHGWQIPRVARDR